jgi:DHA1 family bicyclomycin/chloramphenicol resistance-like MFS transporter
VSTCVTDVEAPPAPRLLRRITVIAIILSWLGPFSMDAYSPSFPALADEYGVGDGAVQLTLSATIIGMCLGQLVVGPISDRRGRRLPLIVALSGYLLASAACAFAPSITVLVIARFFQGVTASAGISTARAIGRDVHSGRELARFFAHLATATAIAPIVGPIVGAVLMDLWSWRLIFVAVTLWGGVALILVIVALPETHRQTRLRLPRVPGQRPPRLDRASKRLLVVVSVTLAFVSGSVMSYLAGSSFVLQDDYGLTSQQYSWVFASNAVGLVVATMIGARLVMRFSAVAILRAALVAFVAVGWALVLAVGLGAGLWTQLVLFFLLVGCLGLLAPNLTTLGMSVSRDHAGRVSGLIGVAQFAVGGLSAPLLGFDLGIGIPTMYLAIAVYATIAGLVFMVGGPWLRGAEPFAGEKSAATTSPAEDVAIATPSL